MPKISYILFLFICFSFSTKLTAQKTLSKDDMTIYIVTHAEANGGEFTINIYKRSNSIKIVYSIFDSIRYSAVRADTSYWSIHKKYMEYVVANDSIKIAKINDGSKKLVDDGLGKIFEHYSVYSRDSIKFNIKKDIAFAGLLVQIKKASQKELEGHSNTNILDCVHVEFTITINSGTKTAYAFCPREKTNPLEYAILTRSLDAYRKRKNSDFLNKRRTLDY